MFADKYPKTFSKNLLVTACILLSVASWWGCTHLTAGQENEARGFFITAAAWPEADKLFRTDNHWLGGDGASSIDLGKGRILWLFGDSFIDPAATGSRTSAVVVRNSLAVQRGHDPSTASIRFYWGTTGQSPSAFFKGDDPVWYWPGGGSMLGHALIIFLMEIRPGSNDLGFEPAGSLAVLVDNPDAPPTEWHLRRLPVPENRFDIIVGSASVLVLGTHLYAFGADTHGDVYLVRWNTADAASGNLQNMYWWTGEGGWVVQHGVPAEKPLPVFPQGQMEFSVHYEPAMGCFLQVQTISLTDPRLGFRTAHRITGPWSPAEPFFRPEEMHDAELLIYAAKAHRSLSGADLAFTYAVNSTRTDRLLADSGIYYPVFVRGIFTEQ